MNAAYQSLASMIGKTEADASIRDYLTTGGQNLDPATTAWCAAAVDSALTQAGSKGTGSLAARSYLNWGQPVEQPQQGDIAVFSRGDPKGTAGHVGFFDGYNPDGSIRVLGGNQGDKVSIATYSPDRLLGFRRGEQQPGNALASAAPTGKPVAQNALAEPEPPQWQSAALDPRAFMTQRNALAFQPLTYDRRT